MSRIGNKEVLIKLINLSFLMVEMKSSNPLIYVHK